MLKCENYSKILKVFNSVMFLNLSSHVYAECVYAWAGGSLVLERNDSLEDRKMVIGSKPPACLNKCMNCRPCIATLVVSQKRKSYRVSSRGDDDDTYYLLAWKCRCGNKVFQPWLIISSITICHN